MSKSSLTVIYAFLIMFLVFFFVHKWDKPRIQKAKDICEQKCGETKYDCRNKCFSYHYGLGK